MEKCERKRKREARGADEGRLLLRKTQKQQLQDSTDNTNATPYEYLWHAFEELHQLYNTTFFCGVRFFGCFVLQFPCKGLKQKRKRSRRHLHSLSQSLSAGSTPWNRLNHRSHVHCFLHRVLRFREIERKTTKARCITHTQSKKKRTERDTHTHTHTYTQTNRHTHTHQKRRTKREKKSWKRKKKTKKSKG